MWHLALENYLTGRETMMIFSFLGVLVHKGSTDFWTLNWGNLYEMPAHLYTFHLRSFAQSCLTICDPMTWSTTGFPVHHQLLELAQTEVHQVWTSYNQPPLSWPPPPATTCCQKWKEASSLCSISLVSTTEKAQHPAYFKGKILKEILFSKKDLLKGSFRAKKCNKLITNTLLLCLDLK